MAWSPSTLRIAIASLLLGTLALAPGRSRAEPVVISVEAHAALALTAPQTDWFGPGGALGVAAHYPLSPAFLLGARLRAGLLTNGDPPELPGVRDPGWGSFELASLSLRFRPFARSADARRGDGLFIDAAVGGGFTGDSLRPSIDAGLGYGFAFGPICLAPSLRYLQVIQPANPPSDDDARLLLAGVELTFNDLRPLPPPPPPQAAPIVQMQAQLPDRDQDGVDDGADDCPDEPEDRDGYRDDDGCPEPDNDIDGILDDKDRCPNAAEDRDGFEDDDGCPEPDNDLDGIPDGNDRCPIAAEVINGVDDLDGCPDEGEIVFKNDRIVLEEKVLFDFEFARVRHRAHKVLDAIVRLRSQHPEWGAIHIEGHCDVRGDDELNQKLSERRARNVMRKLIEWGIPAEVMSYAGYGRTRPIDHGTSEEAHQRNRRVEFVVMTRVPVKAGSSTQPPSAASRHPEPEPEPESEPDSRSPREPAPHTRSNLTPQGERQ